MEKTAKEPFLYNYILKVQSSSHRENQLCLDMDTLGLQHFFEQFIWIFHVLLKISTHYEIATSGMPRTNHLGQLDLMVSYCVSLV
jgi:hypothetical protein